MIPLASRQHGPDGRRHEDGVEEDIDPVRNVLLDDELLAQVDRGDQQHQAERPAVVRVVVGAQVHGAVAGEVRQDERGEHVDQDRLEQLDRECEKRPGVEVPQPEHRPPRLDVDDEQEPCPRDGWPVHAHVRAEEQDAPESLEDLRDRKTEDDRE